MLQCLTLNHSPADNLPASDAPHSTELFSVAAKFNRTFSCWSQVQQDVLLTPNSTRWCSVECKINTTVCSWSHVHQDRKASAPPNTGVRAAGCSGMKSASGFQGVRMVWVGPRGSTKSQQVNNVSLFSAWRELEGRSAGFRGCRVDLVVRGAE